MKLFNILSRSLLITVAMISFTQADELKIPIGAQGADKVSLERPKVGMKADAVETKFGAPLSKSAAVGKPPISSWEYPQFTVYFEADRVIHTVLKPYSDEPAPAAAPVATPAVTEPAPPAAAEPAAISTPLTTTKPLVATNNVDSSASGTGIYTTDKDSGSSDSDKNTESTKTDKDSGSGDSDKDTESTETDKDSGSGESDKDSGSGDSDKNSK